ncbi:MAG: hypothetical protein L6R36_001521 [Xanthoria steineri]|nr:MAG: hypothetical protein L6R36_001521 [Xanthoria steineri]
MNVGRSEVPAQKTNRGLKQKGKAAMVKEQEQYETNRQSNGDDLSRGSFDSIKKYGAARQVLTGAGERAGTKYLYVQAVVVSDVEKIWTAHHDGTGYRIAQTIAASG